MPRKSSSFALFVLPITFLATGSMGAPSIYSPYYFNTYAGTPGVCGNNDGPAASATLCYPWAITVNTAGGLFIAKTAPDRIWEISQQGIVHTLFAIGPALQVGSPTGITVDAAGNIFYLDYLNQVVQKRTPAGQITTIAGTLGVVGSTDGIGSMALFRYPQGLAIDTSGNLYVADRYNHAIRRLSPMGADWFVETWAGNPSIVDQAGQPMPGSSDGIGRNARFNQPNDLSVDRSGNVYVADTYNSTIRRITPGREVTTWAGAAGQTGSADGQGSLARFFYTGAVSADDRGNLFVVDGVNSTIRKISPDRNVTTIGGLAGQVGSVNGTGTVARFRFPHGLVVDRKGNVYVADTSNHTVRRGTPMVLGIDVSHFQNDAGAINWRNVKNSGIVFTYVKATQRATYMDPNFGDNVAGAGLENIITGAYHFAEPEYNDAVDEAEHFLDIAGAYITSGHLRPFLDIEDYAARDSYPSRLGAEALAAWIDDWMGVVFQQTGVKPLLYCGRDYITLLGSRLSRKYDLFFPHYTQDPLSDEDVNPWTDLTLLQYTATGSVGGITGNVDVDVFRGTAEDFQLKLVIPASRVSADGPLNGGRFVLHIFAPGQRQVTVQSSTDLVTWGDVTTLNTSNGEAVFVDEFAGLSNVKFYRLRP